MSEYGPAARPDTPAAWFAGRLATDLIEVSDDPAALDGAGWWAVALTYEGALTAARFGRVETAPLPAGCWPGVSETAWRTSMDEAAYVRGVGDIRAAIAAGDVYQANLCRVLSAPLPTDADVAGLARLLAAGNPAPYGGFLRLPEHGVHVATASPELFVRRSGPGGTIVESGPIKGTGRTEADLQPKDEAENVMIVDLVRNDLSRVCRPGTVSVPSLLAVEQHPGLVHLVSTVRGELLPDAGWPELLAAAFPPGSRDRCAEVQRAADHRRAGAGTPRRLLRCGRLGRRRQPDRRAGRRDPDVLGGRRHAALRHRGRDHVGVGPVR